MQTYTQKQHKKSKHLLALKLYEELTSDIQNHKQNLWMEHLASNWDHRHNTHIRWKTIHGLANRAHPPTLTTSITLNNKIANTPKHIANCFTKQFTNNVRHATHTTDRYIDRSTQKYRDKHTSHNPGPRGNKTKQKYKRTRF